MKKIILLLLAICCMQTLPAQDASPYFASYPTLTPDGNTLIFCYNGSLWKASADGGAATQISAMQGNVSNARVSPDGKWIAFSNTQFGNSDVYIMPLQGGAVKRLTFHAAGDNVESWSWDSRFVYFTSNRYDMMSTYKVNIDGGTPVRVFSNDYFDYSHNAFENPVTGEIFFDDTWESSVFANRLGYKGPFNPDIQSYNPATKKYTRYTQWEGKDLWATIDRNGNVYFASDEANGKYNIYTFVNGKKTALTHFDTPVMNPVVDAAGDKIVFEKDFQIFIYNVRTKKSEKVPLLVYKNNTLSALQNFNVSGKISDFDISGDGKKLAFVSRGKLFVSDEKGKFIRSLPALPQERVTEVYWLKDNKTLIYAQTTKGFTNWFTQDAQGNDDARQVTSGDKNCRSLSFNSDKTKAAYLCGSNEVKLLDLKNMQASTIVKDEIWGLENSAPAFSPDDKYVSYTAFRNFEQDIFLYRLDDGRIFNITNTGVSETGPCWSPDGKYIYFNADRVNPSYPYGPQSQKIYRLPLQKITAPYRSDRFDSLFTEKKKEPEKTDTAVAAKKKKGDEKEKKKEAETAKNTDLPKPVVKIDFNDLMSRAEQVGPNFGMQEVVTAIKNGDKVFVFFVSNHENGKPSLWKITYEPFEKEKTEKIKDADGGYFEIKGYKDHYYVLTGGNISKLEPDRNAADKVSIDYPFTINMNDEFNQMFYEAWGSLNENYYNENFNGVDWKGIRDRYAAFLPQLQTRADFRKLLNNMMGELNTSHYGFSTFGSDENTFYKTTTAASGIVFSNEHPYIVDHVVKNSCADLEDNNIMKGDELISVDGVKVDPSQNREYYFMRSQIPDEMVLKFKRGNRDVEVKIHPEPYYEMTGQLYDEWEAANRRRVDDLSQKQIGYIHMKDMGGGALQEFLQQMVSDSINGRKALILDLRYNTGGNVHDKVLQFLSQRPYLQWKYRDGKMSPQPNFAPAAKSIILLTNEQTLSDGEMTTAGFKELKLGKVVGMPTYRWIIFTSGKGLLDGSFVRLPSWGCFTLNGVNLEQHGVEPDIEVKNTFEDRMKNRDPQIERAVQEIMKELK